MKIGVPKEVKDGETRVAITPNVVHRCVKLGAEILIQIGAGDKAGFLDSEYESAGARLVGSAEEVWSAAELIFKVKEPLPSEFPLIRNGQSLFTYLHLAACPDLARVLLEKKVTGIAYETVEDRGGMFPLLKPMSHIAGRLSVQVGACFLQSQNGGSGVLLGGVPGTLPGKVVILGGGNAGSQACRMAVGMGARVTVLDLDVNKLERLDDEYHGGITTLVANPGNIEKEVVGADLLIGAVLVPAAKAPTVVSADQIAHMRRGSVVVDIAIDQGGCIETIRPTSHHEPTYLYEEVLHYAVPNMPALVGRTSTMALTQATEPYMVALAEHGVEAALVSHAGLAKGVNTKDGRMLNPAVAASLGL